MTALRHEEEQLISAREHIFLCGTRIRKRHKSEVRRIRNDGSVPIQTLDRREAEGRIAELEQEPNADENEQGA